YDEFRKSVTGYPLPEPREITLKIFTDQYEPSPKVTFMFSIYGLSVAHDVSRALPINPTKQCCEPRNRYQSFCKPIFLKPDDPFYSKFQWKCLGFRRTEDCNVCNTTKREQKNGVTAALDGSFIYGTNDHVAKELRTNDGTG
ncbi:major ampullate gland peroxidase, partial [Nephila pilipes]